VEDVEIMASGTGTPGPETPGGASRRTGAARAGAPRAADSERAIETAARRRVRSPFWNVLLIVPLVATLFPGFYNRETPRLFDIPFFYWWQFLCIPIGVICVIVVFLMTRGER
jgi:hypothetical protein